MTTLTKNYSHSDSITSTSTIGFAMRYNRFIEKLKFSHYSIISMSILIGSCLGGVATMKIFENDAPLWQFVLSLSFTMANLVACIAQAPTKWVVNLFTASFIVNTILLILNII